MNSDALETQSSIPVESSSVKQQNDALPDGKFSERCEIIKQAKQTVGRMLRYAIANPDIEVKDDLMALTVKFLCLPANHFTDSDEVQLWKVYAALSKLIKPASDISIQIADGLKDTATSEDTAVVQNKTLEPSTLKSKLYRWFGSLLTRKKQGTGAESLLSKLVDRCDRDLRQINYYLVFFVVLYIVVQCYSALLSDILISSARLIEDLKVQQTSERLINEQTSTAQKKQVEDVSLMLRMQLSASSQTLVDLTKPLSNMPFLRLSNSTEKAFESCRSISWQQDINNNGLTGCIALEREYALSAFTVLSRYILPLLLGFIGATAYVTRLTLYRLSTNSYVPSPRGMMSMRLCLGGLLGAISGIFISSGAKETEGFSISLTLTALLMGYSVEVAFSLFDSAIERLKDWTRGLRPNDEKDSANTAKPDVTKPQN
jgi:hypothetical protein